MSKRPPRPALPPSYRVQLAWRPGPLSGPLDLLHRARVRMAPVSSYRNFSAAMSRVRDRQPADRRVFLLWRGCDLDGDGGELVALATRELGRGRPRRPSASSTASSSAARALIPSSRSASASGCRSSRLARSVSRPCCDRALRHVQIQQSGHAMATASWRRALRSTRPLRSLARQHRRRLSGERAGTSGSGG